jgi:predicted nucleotidyltransferase
MDLPVDFKELLEEFDREKVEVVLVGGYAVAFHGRPRATKDIDLVLESSEANLRRAAQALQRFGAPANVVAAILRMTSAEVVYMGRPPLRVDFLQTIDGIAAGSLFGRAIDAKLDGVPIRVIALDDLIANKRAAGRPQDLLDVEFLERVRAAKT